MKQDLSKCLGVTVRAIKRWHARTKEESRTVDNLLHFLVRNKRMLVYPPHVITETFSKELEWERKNLRSLGDFLASRTMPFRLSYGYVEALLRPSSMYDLEEAGYSFFIAHYHEHPMLEPLIRQSINSAIRLRVVPVYPVDGSLCAWLYDPWNEKVYTFHARAGRLVATPVHVPEPEVLVSVANFSFIVEYKNTEHPFSKEYLTKVQEAKKMLL